MILYNKNGTENEEQESTTCMCKKKENTLWYMLVESSENSINVNKNKFGKKRNAEKKESDEEQ